MIAANPAPNRAEASRVLIIEDEDGTRSSFARTLTATGRFVVDEACDGVEAIGRLQVATYDAVVLDLHLPRVSGIGVLAFMDQHHRNLLQRVVVVTGLELSELRVLFPICATIGKPVSTQRLIDALDRCVVGARSSAEAGTR